MPNMPNMPDMSNMKMPKMGWPRGGAGDSNKARQLPINYPRYKAEKYIALSSKQTEQSAEDASSAAPAPPPDEDPQPPAPRDDENVLEWFCRESAKRVGKRRGERYGEMLKTVEDEGARGAISKLQVRGRNKC